MSLRIVHLSDTHGHRVPVPHGDVLIHTGDFSRGCGTEQDCEDFANWMCDLTHPVKILVPGNHDGFVEREPEEARKLLWPVTLLIDEALVIDDITIYGSPWSVQFLDWAFMKPDADLADVYAKIPPETTILASHGPAYGMFDHLGPQWKDCVEQHVGSRALRERVEALRLPCVLSGHIHDAYGCVADRGTLYANSSILNDDYRVAHAPRVLSARKDLVVETPTSY